MWKKKIPREEMSSVPLPVQGMIADLPSKERIETLSFIGRTLDGRQTYSKFFEIKREIHGDDKSELLDIEKRIPKLKINADQALDMIGEVTRGLQKIKDKTVTLKVNKVGAELPSGGEAIGPSGTERVEPASIGGSRYAAEGYPTAKSSDLNVTVHNHIMDETVSRKFKAQMGLRRYTLGI